MEELGVSDLRRKEEEEGEKGEEEDRSNNWMPLNIFWREFITPPSSN